MTAVTSLTFTVTDDDTARTVGSGDLPVLGTPRLLAWCEAATCAALDDLPTGSTSVGTRVELTHRRPSAVGAQVRVSVEVTERDERSVRFDVTAAHADGEEVARGTVQRAVVDVDRFLGALGDDR